jgi:hypothetical protein
MTGSGIKTAETEQSKLQEAEMNFDKAQNRSCGEAGSPLLSRHRTWSDGLQLR